MKILFVGCSGMVLAITLVLLLGAPGGCAYVGTIPDGNLSDIFGGAIMTNQLLTDSLSVPLDGATTAKVDISTGSGNLTIDRQTRGEPALASGTLEYFEKQGVPTRSVRLDNGQATLTVRGDNARSRGFRLPWAACNGAFEWRIHLNHTVPADITAHSGGGNVKLDLAGMALTRLAADTGGGNMDVVLPDHAANLGVIAKTGAGNVSVDVGTGMTGSNTVVADSVAGNVVVRIPRGVAAKIHATSGLGKVIVDSRFNKLDKNTYQTPDYDAAADKVEITVHSGAGNASINTK